MDEARRRAREQGTIVAAHVAQSITAANPGLGRPCLMDEEVRMSLNDELRALRARAEAKRPPEIVAAMRRAVDALAAPPDYVLVDARRINGLSVFQEAIVKGDATCHAIAAASILAKTTRDALMERYDREYPGYDFALHKGYATAPHREAIRRLGPSPIHRRSFTLLPHPRLWD